MGSFVPATQRLRFLLYPLLRSKRAFCPVRQKHTFSGTIHVVILAALYRPKEGYQASDAHSQSYRYQPCKIAHPVAANLHAPA